MPLTISFSMPVPCDSSTVTAPSLPTFSIASAIIFPSSGDSAEMAEAMDALVGLGYKERDARKIMQEIPKDIKGIEAKVKEALKILGKK